MDIYPQKAVLPTSKGWLGVRIGEADKGRPKQVHGLAQYALKLMKYYFLAMRQDITKCVLHQECENWQLCTTGVSYPRRVSMSVEYAGGKVLWILFIHWTSAVLTKQNQIWWNMPDIICSLAHKHQTNQSETSVPNLRTKLT